MTFAKTAYNALGALLGVTGAVGVAAICKRSLFDMETKTFETFFDIGPFELRQLTQTKPSCFNGMVRVHKYRVTVEQVQEPIEEIHARLRQLWDECKNNMHDRDALVRAGLKYGVDLRKRA